MEIKDIPDTPAVSVELDPVLEKEVEQVDAVVKAIAPSLEEKFEALVALLREHGIHFQG